MGRWDPGAPGSGHPQASGRRGRYVPGADDPVRRPTGAGLDVAHTGREFVPGFRAAAEHARLMLAGDRDGYDELRGAA